MLFWPWLPARFWRAAINIWLLLTPPLFYIPWLAAWLRILLTFGPCIELPYLFANFFSYSAFIISSSYSLPISFLSGTWLPFLIRFWSIMARLFWPAPFCLFKLYGNPCPCGRPWSYWPCISSKFCKFLIKSVFCGPYAGLASDCELWCYKVVLAFVDKAWVLMSDGLGWLFIGFMAFMFWPFYRLFRSCIYNCC